MKGKTAKSQSSKSKTTTSRSNSQKVGVDRDSSVSVRRIENGFIVSESGTKGKGRNMQYYSKEFFSQTNPIAGVSGKLQFGKK